MGATAKPVDGEITYGGSLMHNREPDFEGWATKANLRCADGRTIMKDAFAHQDATTVPLVWQHNHDAPENVLGHGVLENRAEGVWVRGFFNGTPQAGNAKELVQHGDINYLSIFANQLVEKSKNVMHGIIREVSLVLAGANPGATIENVAVQHGDGIAIIEDEAIIKTGVPLAGDPDEEIEHADEKTIQDVYDAMSDDEKNVVHYMVGAALEGAKKDENPDEVEHSGSKLDNKEGTKQIMTRNLFEEQTKEKKGPERHELSHDAMMGIFADAQSSGSFRDAVQGYMIKHGIDNIEILFPDAQAVEATPDFDKRRTEWVAGVMNGTKHSPFTRIKNFWADITHDEARAKGYIKGTMKKEEWFGVSKRTTSPSTVYKKQKLDRDDILDIKDFDVVLWMKAEMRLMLEEELARAILIGDGREVDDEDKIKDPAGANSGEGIRSILNDHELYAATVSVNIGDANSSMREVVESIMRHMRLYKGSGNPTFYSTLGVITEMLLTKDDMGRRLWRTRGELATEMGVANIVDVEVMEDEPDLLGIIVNLKDYTIGTDRGGDITSFEDFDIDYNQHKYLLETRLSGALTKIRSALIIKKTANAAVQVTPTEPAFNSETGVITIPAVTGVVYKRLDTGVTVSAGAMTALAAGASLTIYAEAASSSYFVENNIDAEWTFTRDAA